MKHQGLHFAQLALLTISLFTFVKPLWAAHERDPKVEERIDQIISGMSLDEKIGQLLMVSFGGKEMAPHIEEILRSKKPGAVALFSRNIESAHQAAAFIRAINKANEGNIPLFMSLDQEGGNVARITDHVMVVPSNMALGATSSPAMAYMAGLAQGIDLKTIGFNMNLAPVLDINSNYLNPVIGTRSFGEDPQKVAEFGTWFVRGQQETGLISVAKHFPGHGDTNEDSHQNMPVIKADKTRLDKVELVPFKAAIEAGLDAIVTAHIAVPEVTGDPALPSTLSHKILTKILREELNFDGVIISDGLEMQGILNSYGCGQAAVQTILAGGDMAMILWYPENKVEVFNALKAATQNGTITMARLEESVRRILRLKIKRGILDEKPLPLIEVDKHLAANSLHRQMAQEIAYKSITMLKNNNNILPLSKNSLTGKRTLVIAPSGAFFNTMNKNSDIVATAIPQMGNRGKNKGYLERLVGQGSKAELIVFGLTNNYHLSLLTQLMGRLPNKKFIVVNMGSPYLFNRTAKVSGYILSYSSREEAQRAAAETLLGLSKPSGKLPVSIPGHFKIGYGLTYNREEALAAKTVDELQP